jgi:hypothetical protein
MMLMPAVENIMDSWSPIEPEQVIETLEEEGI